MNKSLILIAAAFFGFTSQALAQSENNDDEIVITDAHGKQEVIDLPEALTNDYDSLLNNYNSKTYLHVNFDCNMPDVNPVYSAEVYKERLSRMPTIIEMPYNDVVQKFIDRYSGRLRRSELKYLPVIESALNPNAVSRVGATGLWQFMITTGKKYGLEVNSLVDERRDPVRASYAAAHYLRDLYKIFGDWNLGIAAYNCGPEAINRAIHRSNGEKDYWRIYPYLPKETRGYVPAFIAANYIMNYYCEHNICPMRADLPVKTDTVVVNRDVHFEQVAKVLGMDVDQVKQLNPQYRRNVVNGRTKPSALRLPVAMVGNFIDNEDSIYAYRPDELLTKRLEVAVNTETPTVSYRSKGRGRHSKSRTRRGSNGRRRSVTIRQGDTLSEIARRSGTTVSKLKRLNNISGTNIRAGKKLRVK